LCFTGAFDWFDVALFGTTSDDSNPQLGTKIMRMISGIGCFDLLGVWHYRAFHCYAGL
jgi:hypothetical protein